MCDAHLTWDTPYIYREVGGDDAEDDLEDDWGIDGVSVTVLEAALEWSKRGKGAVRAHKPPTTTNGNAPGGSIRLALHRCMHIYIYIYVYTYIYVYIYIYIYI